MTNNKNYKHNYLDEVIEVFSEFSEISDGLFTSEELLLASDNFLKISKGSVTNKKVYEGSPKPSTHSRDTFIAMTKNSWNLMRDFKKNVECYDNYEMMGLSGYQSFQSINQGW